MGEGTYNSLYDELIIDIISNFFYPSRQVLLVVEDGAYKLFAILANLIVFSYN
jgi:hypothetical protein